MDNYRCVLRFLVRHNCAPFPKYCGQEKSHTVHNYCIESVHSNVRIMNLV